MTNGYKRINATIAHTATITNVLVFQTINSRTINIARQTRPGVDNVKPWSWNIENGFRLKLDGTLHKSTVELHNKL